MLGHILKLRFIHLVLIQVFMSCSPTSLILNQTKIVSYYFDTKISKMNKDDAKDSIFTRRACSNKGYICIWYSYGKGRSID